MITLSKAAVRLKRLLTKGDLTQSEFARQAGVSQQSVSKWLVAGVRPGYDAMVAIHRAFGIPVEDWAIKSRSPDAVATPWFQPRARGRRRAFPDD